MRKKELYYKVLMEKAKNFIQNYESEKMSKEEFILRQVIKSKEFKKELEKENEKGVRFLFSFNEGLNRFIYEAGTAFNRKEVSKQDS